MSKILAIDYGTKNIGLALTDESANFAFAYQTLKNNGERQTIQELKKIINQENVHKIILGWPTDLNSRQTATTKLVKKFSQKLKQDLNLPIILFDERLTSVQAKQRQNKNKKDLDVLSAQLILETWLKNKPESL